MIISKCPPVTQLSVDIGSISSPYYVYTSESHAAVIETGNGHILSFSSVETEVHVYTCIIIISFTSHT